MSEIKFKVFNKDKKYLNPQTFNVYDIADECYLSHISGGDEPKSGEDILGFRVTDNLSFLRYTGFKARNDQEVYDGDILLDLTYRDTPMYYVVSWSQAKGTWMLHRKDKESDGRVLAPMYQSFLAGGVTSELEVVGNIHTDKEGKDERA